METLVIQFTIVGYPALDENARVELRNSEIFKPLPPKQAEQAWGSPVPNQICFSVQAQESAIFITEDWVATIRSRRLIDCVGGMCALINALRQKLDGPIAVELSDIYDSGGNSLYRQLDRERVWRRYRTIGLWFFTVMVSGLAGALIQWIFWGG